MGQGTTHLAPRQVSCSMAPGESAEPEPEPEPVRSTPGRDSMAESGADSSLTLVEFSFTVN